MSRTQPRRTTHWWHEVGDPGDHAYDLEHLDDALQAAYDELKYPDPQLIVRTLYHSHPDVNHEFYWPLEQRARRRWWPHLAPKF